LRSLLFKFHCFFILLVARFLILNWFKVLPLFMDNRSLSFLLLDGSRLLSFGRGLMLSLGLAMSSVAARGRFLLSHVLLTVAVGALDFLAFSVVACNLITRFDSLGVHLAVVAHLRG
jgi:hypothetical protein